MKCQKCNAEIPVNAEICLNCFTEVSNNKETPSCRKKNFFRKFLPISGVLFFIIILTSFSLYKESSLDRAVNDSPISDCGETENVTPENEDGKSTGFLSGIFQKANETEDKNAGGFWNSIFSKTEKDNSNDTQNTTTSVKPTDTESGTHKTENGITTESTTSLGSLKGESSSSTTADTTVSSFGDSMSPEDPSKIFEFVPYGDTGKKISITKYNGNAAYVTVPDYINGLMVVKIQTGAFSDNPNIKTVDIIKGERSYINLDDKCFSNCSSLETINLYDNDLGLSGEFAVNCPIKNFNITYWQYKFVNGALYSNNSRYWEFKYFAGNSCYSTLTLESWCKQISTDNNLSSAYNLKVINAHKDITYIPCYSYDYTTNLEAINVEDCNEMYCSKDGVLFSKYALSSSSKKYVGLYPYSKRDKVFVMPEKDGYTFSLSGVWGKVVNPYVEEMYLPKNASISLGSNESSFPSLKKLYYKSGHPDYDKIKFEFTGETSVY